MQIELVSIETVNFYGDDLDVIISDDNVPYVAVEQISRYLGLDIKEVWEMFEKDPRVDIFDINDVILVALNKLNAMLFLIPFSMVPSDAKDDLFRYQAECSDVLSDYWLHGAAINRRETPYNINSKFTDDRKVSRPALTKACAAYCKNVGGDLDPHDIFDKVLAASYKRCNIDPKHEFEKLTGSQAKFLAWVESCYAKAIEKFAVWNEEYDDVVAEAHSHVQEHILNTKDYWGIIAGNVPAGMYENGK